MSEERLARYRLLRRIGAGGMAEVFRAALEGAEGVTRELVVKRVHHRLAQDPDAVAMFIEEARIAARLRHPNVVQVYEFGRAGGDYFLAMELVEGCDLATLVRAMGSNPAPMGMTAWVMGELLEALSYVHGLRDDDGRPLGLVHRDVSPHNVLVGVAGEVKLADFGIAKAAKRIGDDAGEGRVRGKLAYMAPEQARGEAPDARADLFGAGAVLYELLSGHRPYRDREDATTAEVVRAGDIVPIRERAPWLSDELSEVVMRAVAPDREARFDDASAFRDALRAAFAEDAVVADRAMLQSGVRAALEQQREGAPPRAERTETADEPAQPAPEPVAPVAELPSTRPRAPTPATRGRLLAERLAIAVAVLVVAVLAERRTRPPPPTPPPPREAPVTLALPPSAPRLAPELLQRVARTCAVELQLGDRSAADLVLGPWRGATAATGEVAAIEPWLDPEARAQVARASRSLGVAFRAEADAPGVIRFAPVGVDPVVFFARSASVRALASVPRSVLEAQRPALAEVFGRAPRDGRVPSEDLDGWSVWDVMTASIALHGSAFDAWRVWAPAGDTETASLTWTARAASHDPDAARDLAGSAGVTALLGWDRALHALDALVIGADTTDDDLLPPADPTVAFGWAPLSRLRGASRAGWRVARPPRGDDWQLDARGEPTRVGAHVVPAEVFGWSASTRGAGRAVVRCALVELARSEVAAALRGATGWSPIGAPPAWADAAFDPALREALEGGHVTALRDGGAAPAALRAALWTLWREAVLVGVRADARDDVADRTRWGVRARALLAPRAAAGER